MADANHYDEAADGLEAAAKALRACADEYDDDGEDTPQSSQPKSLSAARRETKRQYAKARGEKSRDTED